MRRQLYCIVEGHGEKKAIPVLIKLVLKHYYGQYEVEVAEGHFLSRGQIVQGKTEFKKALLFAQKSIRRAGSGLIGVFLDADDDTVASLTARINQHTGTYGLQFPAIPIIFTKEYEAFFILDQLTLRNHKRVRASPNFAPIPEAIRDAKGHFQSQVLDVGDKYDVIVDQELFTRYLDCTTLDGGLTVWAPLKVLVADLVS